MSYKCLIFSSPCNLYIKNFQIVYEPLNDKEEKVHIPLEDVGTIILENPQISITNYLLSLCSDYNVTVFTCDIKHKPNGIMLPFYQHSRNTKTAFAQINMTEPLKKKIWQKIIKQKIKNQSNVIKILFDNDELDFYVNKVQSGDTKNIEAYVSKKYWQILFDDFKRHANDKQNSALDYGYAIIRGCLSKHIASSGLIPCLGIHHKNELNAFNLTEDLIEPFRPFVDLMVKEMNIDNNESLSKEDKLYLVSILTSQCQYKKEQITVQNACENVCKSFVNAINKNDITELELPEFIEAK